MKVLCKQLQSYHADDYHVNIWQIYVAYGGKLKERETPWNYETKLSPKYLQLRL